MLWINVYTATAKHQCEAGVRLWTDDGSSWAFLTTSPPTQNNWEPRRLVPSCGLTTRPWIANIAAEYSSALCRRTTCILPNEGILATGGVYPAPSHEHPCCHIRRRTRRQLQTRCECPNVVVYTQSSTVVHLRRCGNAMCIRMCKNRFLMHYFVNNAVSPSQTWPSVTFATRVMDRCPQECDTWKWKPIQIQNPNPLSPLHPCSVSGRISSILLLQNSHDTRERPGWCWSDISLDQFLKMHCSEVLGMNGGNRCSHSAINRPSAALRSALPSQSLTPQFVVKICFYGSVTRVQIPLIWQIKYVSELWVRGDSMRGQQETFVMSTIWEVCCSNVCSNDLTLLPKHTFSSYNLLLLSLWVCFLPNKSHLFCSQEERIWIGALQKIKLLFLFTAQQKRV